MASGNSRYEVVSNYDKNKKYSVKITPRITKTFQKFSKGDLIVPHEFAKNHQNDKNWLTVKTYANAMNVVYLAMKIGKDIGLVREILPETHKTTFDEF